MPFQLVLSDGIYRGKGDDTAHDMSTAMHGRTVAKFEYIADRSENHLVTLTFSNGDYLQLYNVPPHRCRVTFQKKGK
jgi:hypothetical protein